jgi:hypothetical protein
MPAKNILVYLPVTANNFITACTTSNKDLNENILPGNGLTNRNPAI